MRFSFKYRMVYLIGVVLLTSCTERVDFDLKATGYPKLVVFGEITSDAKQHEIHLGKSAPYFYNQPMETVSGAIVSIEDLDAASKIILKEISNRPGVYRTPSRYFGIVGHQYQLNISNVDVNNDGVMETYSAKTTMMPSPPINGILVVYNPQWKGWEVKIYSKDNPDTKDYYLFKVHKNGVLYTDSISDYWITDDRFFNGNDINGPTVQFFDEEQGDTISNGDTITLEMDGITQDYYDFIGGVQTEISEKVPLFSGPSANVKGNISNGALGFFAVMEVQRDSYIYKGETSQ